MTKTDIFANLSDFMKYAPGIGAETSYDQLHTHIRVTTSEIWKYITVPVYMALRSDIPEDTPEDEKDTLQKTYSEGLELLKTAIAAGTAYKFQIFATVAKAGSEASLYKYQHEELKRSYLDAYWTALDELLDWLRQNSKVGDYENSQEYQDIQALPLRDADEFDRYFQIDRSSYFFSRVQYIIRSEWDKIRKNTDSAIEEQMALARKAVAYRTMAKVVLTFDVTEWPKSIRYDINHEYAKGTAPQSRQILARTYLEEADSAEKALSELRSDTTGGGLQNFNKENNKHFTIL